MTKVVILSQAWHEQDLSRCQSLRSSRSRLSLCLLENHCHSPRSGCSLTEREGSLRFNTVSLEQPKQRSFFCPYL